MRLTSAKFRPALPLVYPRAFLVVCPLISVICLQTPMAKFLMLFILVTLVVLMILATFKGKK